MLRRYMLWLLKHRIGFLRTGLGYRKYTVHAFSLLPPFVIPIRQLNYPWVYYGIESAIKAQKKLEQDESLVKYLPWNDQ